jgi:uncharacterized membrane protein YfcA
MERRGGRRERAAGRAAWFGAWLAAAYATWGACALASGFAVALAERWPIAVAMLAGSYFAGSTPVGGGAVAFPILTLGFGEPASLGRDFSLAVQSVGMTSASLYLWSQRRRVARGLLVPGLAGALVATPIGVVCLAPRVPDAWVRLAFASLWAGFGVLVLARRRALEAAGDGPCPALARERSLGFAVGAAGGALASITGSGADMLTFSTLTLLRRTDPRIAIPTAVVMMAATSVIGLSSQLMAAAWVPGHAAVAAPVWPNLLVATPIVLLGAPLGALAVNVIPRAVTLRLVALLCLLQLAWTLVALR